MLKTYSKFGKVEKSISICKKEQLRQKTFKSENLKFCMKKSWQDHDKWQKNSMIDNIDNTGWHKEKYWQEMPLKNPYIYGMSMDPLKLMDIAM